MNNTAKELVQLDLFQARANRDAGMLQAADHANQVHEDWSEKAYQFLLNYARTHNGLFMAENVREAAAKENFPEPPSQRAWGHVFQRAAREQKIKRRGYGQVKNIKAHCANATVWIGAHKKVS